MSAGTVIEEVVDFDCAQARLWGIVSRPAGDVIASTTVVLIIVGGPQYRVGSHRQFVSLARTLAAAGFPTMRFDATGMGDSEGDKRGFEDLQPDIAAALDALSRACPGSQRMVVWGLCDAASAAMMFATNDPRVAGIVAANPWARSDASLAAAQVKYYYAARVLQRDFWSKLLHGELQWGASLRSLATNLKGARSHRRDGATHDRSFHATMARGLAAFRGRVLLILSGNDLTAKEFVEHANSSHAWSGLLSDPKVSRLELPQADHTFSRQSWREEIEKQTVAWLNSLGDSRCAVATNATH